MSNTYEVYNGEYIDIYAIIDMERVKDEKSYPYVSSCFDLEVRCDGHSYYTDGMPYNDDECELEEYVYEAWEELDRGRGASSAHSGACAVVRAIRETNNFAPKKEEKKEEPTNLEKLVADIVASEASEKIFERVSPKVEQRIFERFGFMPEKHEIKLPNGKTNSINEVTHEVYDKVLKLVACDTSVFLCGPAGTGKNVICKQVAKGLGLDFYFTNAVTQEYQLKGFIDANGHYHETQFYQAFTKGGLFFLDEMDASIPETLVILNAALANKYFDFPTGRIEAHPDFRVIAAGNTVGLGANIEYVGRFQLDAASLDRFALVFVNYSPKIEMEMARGNADLCQFAEAFRKATQSCGVKCLCTYRAIKRISDLQQISDDLPDILEMSLTKGLRKDDVHILNVEIAKHLSNDYTKALYKLEERL